MLPGVQTTLWLLLQKTKGKAQAMNLVRPNILLLFLKNMAIRSEYWLTIRNSVVRQVYTIL